MKINNNVEEQEIVARFAKAMGHPTRLRYCYF
jgi:hypothetical protein